MKDEHDVDAADSDAEAFFKSTVLIITYYVSMAFAFAVVIAIVAAGAVLVAKLLGA